MNTSPATLATLFRFRYTTQSVSEGGLTFAFAAPRSGYVLGEAQTLSDLASLEAASGSCWYEIILVSALLKDEKQWPKGLDVWLRRGKQTRELSVRAADTHVVWRDERAIIVASPQRAPEVIEAVIEFTYFERELAEIEAAIAVAWPLVEADTPLAYDVSSSSLKHDAAIGERVREVLQRRTCLARIEPHLYRPPSRFSNVATKLGEDLREAALCEERAETADGQIEVQEYVYEMVSQRLGEFRYARKGIILEVVIVALLAAEVIIMLIRKSLTEF